MVITGIDRLINENIMFWQWRSQKFCTGRAKFYKKRPQVQHSILPSFTLTAKLYFVIYRHNS